jgi:hypothetical protein
MEPASTSPISGAEQIAALRADLDQKDATIDLLAKQLEEAANRLDWISRCGPDKEAQSSSKPADGQAGAHLADGETTDRLNRFLQQWEEAEFGESLERIDRRLSHVFEVLKSFDAGDARTFAQPSLGSPPSRPADPPAELATGSLLTAYLMSQPPERASPPREETVRPTGGDDAASGLAGVMDHADVCLLPLPDFNVPKPVELETADVEALRAAVIERDECIQQLLARCRMAESNRTLVPDWNSLANAPEDLRERVAQLELDLQQRIKQEELHSSIERAKLFRDRVHLDQVRKELEAQIRKLGQLQQSAPKTSEEEGKGAGKRWGKMFGR